MPIELDDAAPHMSQERLVGIIDMEATKIEIPPAEFRCIEFIELVPECVKDIKMNMCKPPAASSVVTIPVLVDQNQFQEKEQFDIAKKIFWRHSCYPSCQRIKARKPSAR